MRLKCWWFGCDPIGGGIECFRCGDDDGYILNLWSRLKFHLWWIRSSIVMRCHGCGKIIWFAGRKQWCCTRGCDDQWMARQESRTCESVPF